jgi:phospholipid/cholesterol/gamma-HCH transport system substrate-binding protein
MSRTSKRVIVFMVIIIGLLIIIFSYLYLAGIYPGVHGYKAVVFFNELSGLKTGSSVFIRGMEKGKVTATDLVDNGQMVRVQIILDKSIKLTQDTKFAIRSLSLFGTDRILIITPGTGPVASAQTKFYGNNEVLELEEFFLKFDKVVTKLESMQLDDELKILKKELFASFDSVAKGFQKPVSEITGQLEALVIRFDTLSTYLKSEGTVRELITNPELYQEIRDTNQKLKELLEDIKNNPKKYFTVKIF